MPNIVFYNLDALERHRIIYLFEGIINGLSYETLCAKDNYICTLGIKADECLKLAASYPDIEFRLAYDPDEAGLRAAMSIERKLPNLSSDPGYYKALFKRYLPELPWSDQDTGMDMNDLLCHLGYPYEERAAIMEVDAGLPRPEAEKSSLALLMRETNQL
ncbi:MAG: toprim domain-containing protein [Candidatus Cloacimonetes bacterium]|nr:toprim domain-containing protein [Candidatus Cloacimonadota bacterium]